jgi:hypothetical protein
MSVAKRLEHLTTFCTPSGDGIPSNNQISIMLTPNSNPENFQIELNELSS